MNIKHIITIITVVIVLFLPAFVYAQDKTIIEGTLQGADCTYLGKQCPKDMAPGRVALESDFVLTTKDGDVFYIPNISKTVKGTYIHVPVRIKGTINQDILKAETLEIKKDGKYSQVWNNGAFFKR